MTDFFTTFPPYENRIDFLPTEINADMKPKIIRYMSNEAKRKVEGTSLEEYDLEEEDAKRSKIIVSSTQNTEEPEMDEVLQAIRMMRKKIKEGFQNSKVEREEIKSKLVRAH
ncbi:hypothetical protein HHI36_005494 [Cryptolaemus montrouzieri]|uniref:Uncharacterized protein n=1 Tax=Cryptolaemus montrouzieri TaxID=559131 RepID=A0ABD2NVW2_9CUCU